MYPAQHPAATMSSAADEEHKPYYSLLNPPFCTPPPQAHAVDVPSLGGRLRLGHRPGLPHGREPRPGPVQPLLPERDLVVAGRDGQHVPRDRPAHAPDGRVEPVHQLGAPGRRLRGLRPHVAGAVLGARGDQVAGQPAGGRPGHVAHPVPVRVLLLGLLGPGQAVHAPPEPHLVVAGASGQPARAPGGGGGPLPGGGGGVRGADGRGRGPADSVAPQRRVLEVRGAPGVVRVVAQHRHAAVGPGAGEQQALLVRRPAHAVHAGLVEPV
mmetsp:Transcript_18365/g.30631  ORF Transcript_18365/g.30631 Transcript_18365/m.30631 type:complete len:268 (-) Transcript_18365:353-1156(-)